MGCFAHKNLRCANPTLQKTTLTIAEIIRPEVIKAIVITYLFEELFFIQLKLFKEKGFNKKSFRGARFPNAKLITKFYNDHLPFDLTGAQKRVVKEIREDYIAE